MSRKRKRIRMRNVDSVAFNDWWQGFEGDRTIVKFNTAHRQFIVHLGERQVIALIEALPGIAGAMADRLANRGGDLQQRADALRKAADRGK